MNALILVDIQNDFVPGGALAVREGDAIVPIVNSLLRSQQWDVVVATQDWHPADHGSFAANHASRHPGELIELHGLPQVLWPVHCVQGTKGAEFVPSLETAWVEEVFQKGTDPTIDSYSGFFDNGHRKATGLSDYLKQRGVTEVSIVGLATDYCVKFTALDALTEGFGVTLIEDACRGVNLKPGDVAAAVEEMRAKGVLVTQSGDLQKHVRYVVGDATVPAGDGPKVIAHVCNDVGGWGKGFVVPLGRRYPAAEKAYRDWFAGTAADAPHFELGKVQIVQISPNLWVGNMIGQHGLGSKNGVPPVRYEAIREAMDAVAQFAASRNATIHLPRIGCGLAGGRWSMVGRIVDDACSRHGATACVYDLPARKD